jgi:hypothetical protein
MMMMMSLNLSLRFLPTFIALGSSGLLRDDEYVAESLLRVSLETGSQLFSLYDEDAAESLVFPKISSQLFSL